MTDESPPLEVVWSKAADRDVARLYEYLYPRNPRAFRSLLRHFFDALDRLAELPRTGRRSELRTDREYRELVIEHYKIFYFVEGTRLFVSRLWDTRPDPTRFSLP